MSETVKESKKENFIVKFFKEWGIALIGAALLALVINKFIFVNVSSPTPSMEPTIMVNERVFVSRIFSKDKLQRGDIVIFWSEERHNTMLKRVIGVSGDKIEIKENGDVIINGEKIQEEYVKRQIKEGSVYPGLNFGTYNVPEGKVFLMGDNRSNSRDSRYWNDPYVDCKEVKGVAKFIFFPFNKIRSLGKFK